MQYKYKIIKVDIGEDSDGRKAASEMLCKGGELGWRIIHIEHDVLNAKIVWMEKVRENGAEPAKEEKDDKENLQEVRDDSPGAGDGPSGEENSGGEESQGN